MLDSTADCPDIRAPLAVAVAQELRRLASPDSVAVLSKRDYDAILSSVDICRPWTAQDYREVGQLVRVDLVVELAQDPGSPGRAVSTRVHVVRIPPGRILQVDTLPVVVDSTTAAAAQVIARRVWRYWTANRGAERR